MIIVNLIKTFQIGGWIICTLFFIASCKFEKLPNIVGYNNDNIITYQETPPKYLVPLVRGY